MKKNFITMCFILFFVIINIANANDIAKNLPKVLSEKNFGTEFYSTFHPTLSENGADEKNVVYVYSEFETQATLKIPGAGIEITKDVYPEEVTVFEIDKQNAQPYVKETRDDPLPDSVWKGRAIIVEAEQPVACYSSSKDANTTEGSLLMPFESLGTGYVISSHEATVLNYMKAPSYASVVAAYDDTEFEIIIGGNNMTETKSGLKKGDSKIITLDKGDVWMAGTTKDGADLTGSVIRANKPVAVFGGNSCAFIGENSTSCDYIFEQEIPVSMWGTKFHIPQITTDKKSVELRVIASEPNTEVTLNKESQGIIPQAGGGKDEGWMSLTIDDELKIYTLTASAPVSIVAYTSMVNPDDQKADPFQMNILPDKQMVEETEFYTYGKNTNSETEDNYVTVVFRYDDVDGESDVDFGEVTTTGTEWESLEGAQGGNIRFFGDQVQQGYKWAAKVVNVEKGKNYRIRSEREHAVYHYGFSSMMSYGFPLSIGNEKDFSDNEPPKLEYAIFADGSLWHTYHKKMKPIVLDQGGYWESARLNSVNFNSNETFNFNFEQPNFRKNIDIQTDLDIGIADIESEGRLSISLRDGKGNETEKEINFTPEVLTFDKQEVVFEFGSQQTETIKKTVVVKNETMKNFMIKGLMTREDFSSIECNCSSMGERELAMGDTAHVIVTLSPEGLSSFDKHLVIQTEIDNMYEKYFEIPIKGYASTPEFYADDIEEIDVPTGLSSDDQIMTVYNDTDSEISISNIELSDNIDMDDPTAYFSIKNLTLPTAESPLNIPAGESEEITVVANGLNDTTVNASIKFYSENYVASAELSMTSYSVEVQTSGFAIDTVAGETVKGNLVITNPSEKTVYLYGMEFSGDAGQTDDKVIKTDEVINGENKVEIYPAGEHIIEFTCYSGVKGMYIGDVTISGNIINGPKNVTLSANFKEKNSVFETNALDKFSAYFRNSSEEIVVDIKNNELLKGELGIYDHLGRVIYIQSDVTSNELRINVSGFNTGVYFVTIEKNNRIYTGKVMVIK